MELSLTLFEEIAKAEIDQSSKNQSALTSVIDLDFQSSITFNGHHTAGAYLQTLSLYYEGFKSELVKVINQPDLTLRDAQVQCIDDVLRDLQHSFKKERLQTGFSRAIVNPSLLRPESPLSVKAIKKKLKYFFICSSCISKRLVATSNGCKNRFRRTHCHTPLFTRLHLTSKNQVEVSYRCT